jgi:Family of unknown function (DUF5985)
MSEVLIPYLGGAVTLGYFTAGALFLRFWRRTRDRLFLAFATAFGLLALNQLIATLLEAADEGTVYAYALRVLGFVLILWAIIDKNVSARRR